MNLIIKEMNDKNVWEGFLLGCNEKTFLQSWNWGEFQKRTGEKIWRLGVFNPDLVGVGLVVKIAAKRGKFLFVPHGPIVKIINDQLSLIVKKKFLKALLEELKKIAKEEKCGFVRIAPIWQRTKENKKIFTDLGFKEAPMHMHPELTWELPLKESTEEILAAMRKTTRYLIKQGLRNKELKIEKSQDPKDIEIFNALYQKTVSRHHFVPFSLNYLKNEFQAFLPDDQALIFLAKYREQCLACAIIIFWQGIAFYHQGASSQNHPKIPASYLLQWEVIKEAKQRGCRLYNFWGITEEKTKRQKHPWRGLTLFKKGFSGYEQAYLKTQDLPLSLKYWLTFALEKMRKKRRGL